jgi:hypothetical protein
MISRVVVGSRFTQSCRASGGRISPRVQEPKVKRKRTRRDRPGVEKYAFRNKMMKSHSGITVRERVSEEVFKCIIMPSRFLRGLIIGYKITRIACLNYNCPRHLQGLTYKHHQIISTQTLQYMLAVTLSLALQQEARDQVLFIIRQFPSRLNSRTKRNLCSIQPRFTLT